MRLDPDALAAIADEAERGVTRARSRAIGVATVSVANVGARAGAESVLLFAAPVSPHPADGAPRAALVEFERVALGPGESAELRFVLRAHHLTLFDRDGARAADGVREWTFWTGAARDADRAARGVAVALEVGPTLA